MKRKLNRRDLLELFEKFIRDSEHGVRVKMNGHWISKNTIQNYRSTFRYLELLNNSYKEPLSINFSQHLNYSEFIKEKSYWMRFYRKVKLLMYKHNCSDNYIGMVIKVIRTFFRYLEFNFNIPVYKFYRYFYSPKAETPVYVMDQEKLRFLISNENFDNSLPSHLKRCKDILVFGCSIGLRYSDLQALSKRNVEFLDGSMYIVTTSKKTNVTTRIKVPKYVNEIVNFYATSKTLLPMISLHAFNKNIKRIAELAGWDYPVSKYKFYKGLRKQVKNASGKEFRFCDLMSSHIMRKTTITTMLMLGMPELLVKRISGHAANSKEFYKYVKYSESFIDSETDRVFKRLIDVSNV